MDYHEQEQKRYAEAKRFNGPWGGPAFSRAAGPEGASRCNGDPGMSLRDYFAAAALQGYLASYAVEALPSPPPDKTAQYAYEYADAMLAQRAKQ